MGPAAAFDDFARLCASNEVDAIYIGTPHSTHFGYARDAVIAGKHVLCEKPLTMTAAEAQELGRLAVEHGVFLMEAMWMKFSPAMRRTVELVDSGRIGEVRHLQTGLGYPVPPDGPRRFWEAALGGGALFDMGVYQIALARLLFGDPVAITVTGDLRPDGVDLHESYTLEFASGATAQSITSITSFVPPRGWLSGTKGAITFDEPLFSPASITVTTGRPPAPPSIEVIEFAKEGAGYVPMLREVSQCILDGRPDHPTHPVSATVEVLQTTEEIRAMLAKAGGTATTLTT